MSANHASSTLSLEPMNEIDVAAVADIDARAQLTPWSEALFSDCLNSGYSCYILKNAADIIIGFQILSFIFDESHLLNIAVDPAFQGRGLGQFMLNDALALAKRRQSRVMFLEVRNSNSKAQRLYTLFGFQHYHTRRDYYRTQNGHEDALLMQCLL